jgi:hypothetical protein
MSQTTYLQPPGAGAPAARLDPAYEANGVIVAETRPRQTQAQPSPFRELVAGGVAVLMSGAAAATSVMGAAPLAAAARSVARSALDPFAGASAARVTGLGAKGDGSPPSAATPGGEAASDASDLATMQAMQRESQAFNMQLLALQDQVQQDSQRFSTLSNVLRAKHDTAKAAVSNIRS